MRAGALLPEADKAALKEINKELSTLTTKYDQNLMKGAKNGAVIVDNAADLDGLSPEQAGAAAEAAISRAQSHLAAINNAVLVPAVQSGDDGDGYRWSSRVTLAGTAPAPGKVRSGPWAYGTALYNVSVTIFWREGLSERHFVLSSARLGPARRTAP